MVKTKETQVKPRRRFLAPALVMLGILYLVLEFLHSYQMARNPDYDHYGTDSYGTLGHGFHGVPALLERFGLTVERVTFPPPESLSTGDTLFLFEPKESTLISWQVPIQETVEWARKNQGHIVLASDLDFGHRARPQSERLMELLGVPGVRVNTVKITPETTFTATSSSTAIKLLEDFYYDDDEYYSTLSVEGSGVFSNLSGVDRISINTDNLSCLNLGKMEGVSSSTLYAVQKDGSTSYTIAARFPLGSGSLTLVGDTSIFCNGVLKHTDNSVLLAALASQGSKRVVIDEFYHDHMVRSSAWLLGLPGYALMLTAMLLATGLWLWRASFRLGPPMPERMIVRRTITEYLDGIGHLFIRRKKYHFLLNELYDGALWSLRREHRIPVERDNFEELIAAIARHSPQRADNTRKTLNHIQTLLQQNRISETQFINAAKEITQCL